MNIIHGSRFGLFLPGNMIRTSTGSISKYTIGKRRRTRNPKSFSATTTTIRATVKGTPIRKIPPMINQGNSLFKVDRKIFIDRTAKIAPAQHAPTVKIAAKTAFTPFIRYAGEPTRKKIRIAQSVVRRNCREVFISFKRERVREGREEET